MNREPLQWSVFSLAVEPRAVEGGPAETPVLVVSRESANQALPMVTVLPLVRMKEGRRIYPNETLLPSGVTEFGSPAVLMAHQIRTILKSRLSSRLGSVEDPELRSAVQDAVRVQLDLGGVFSHEIESLTRLESGK